ncbi:TonB-dependent receptor domain-containing protein [Methylobacterium oryzae CBMB20]
MNYELAPGLVPYASYATTFTPQVGVNTVTGRPYRPATGDQIEAGVKYLIPGTNISAGIAGFDINQTSILRQDPTSFANQVATGEVNSRGFEMEATARFAPGTNLTVAYTHLDFRFVKQTSAVTGAAIDGNQLSGIPGDTFASFLTYLFPPSSALRGLTHRRRHPVQRQQLRRRREHGAQPDRDAVRRPRRLRLRGARPEVQRLPGADQRVQHLRS